MTKQKNLNTGSDSSPNYDLSKLTICSQIQAGATVSLNQESWKG
jgi:hypothetical protein